MPKTVPGLVLILFISKLEAILSLQGVVCSVCRCQRNMVDTNTAGAWTGCSARRRLFNILGCILVVPAVCLLTVQSLYPMTLDLLVSIILAEYNRFANERRRMPTRLVPKGLTERDGCTYIDEKQDPEMLTTPTKNDCVAAVVGYREDPVLFTQALESYNAARGHVFMCVGIDGDTEEDQEMVDVFNEVGTEGRDFSVAAIPPGMPC